MKRRFILLLLALLPVVSRLDAQQAALDTTTFVVLGGGLSAGMSDSVLKPETQKTSFPALMATQMNALMPLPLFRDGGPVTLIPFNPRSSNLPPTNQSTLRALPFPLFTFNLSVPFLKVSEGLNIRPALPLVREGDFKNSLINLILGYPGLVIEHPVSWSQIEYAEIIFPTFIIVEMGFGDVADAALAGDVSKITSSAAFAKDYATLAKRLKDTTATVLLMNIPDPTDTAYFATADQAAAQYGVTVTNLKTWYGVQSSDLITLGGMVEIAERIDGRRNDPLSAAAVLRSSVAAAVQSAVRAMNSAISDAATSNGLKLFDLNAFIKEVRSSGVQAGQSRLGGRFSEGFYSLDGLFPTSAGQAVLANRLLQFVNNSYRTNYSLINYDTIPRAPSIELEKAGGKSLISIPGTQIR